MANGDQRKNQNCFPHRRTMKLAEACGWDEVPAFPAVTASILWCILRPTCSATAIRDRPTSPRSPWQNGYAERLVGLIRRECIDHVIVFGERHLRHLLRSYLLLLQRDAHTSILGQGCADLARDRGRWPDNRPADPGWIASPIRADMNLRQGHPAADACFVTVLKLERRVSHEGMVSIGGNLYSVPDTTRRRILDVHVFADEICIFEDGVLIATHVPLEGRDQEHVNPEPRNIFVATAPTPERWKAHRHSPACDQVARRSLDFYDEALCWPAIGARISVSGLG